MPRTTGKFHAGCSKRSLISPAQSRRAETRRSAGKAAGESKPEAYPVGYVEDFDKPRTKLKNFFSILLRLHQHLHELLRFRSFPITRAEDLVADNPQSIDQEGHRKAPCAIG